ncbi:MAG: TetR/AcrR family transcriptional regulator [candidate division Zixibacteria bacterium]|nr:TetR/AcrR family transcriptional regulator [candidate division Zixibacteria bacterium]
MQRRKQTPDSKQKPRNQKTTREKILTNALTEFARHGLDGARVDRIADTAGVNKAMIYYYFSSKEELYNRTIIEFFSVVINKARLAITGGDSLEARLAALADMYVDVFTEHAEFSKLFLRELANPSSKITRKVARLWIQSGAPEEAEQLFRSGIADGQLRRVNTTQAIVSFLVMNIGYILMSPVLDRVFDIPDRKEFLRERKKSVVDLFMNGVKAK